MIALRRGTETVKLKFLLWETIKTVAKQHGWRPAGAFDAGKFTRHSTCLPGRAVSARDARALANAIERLVNSEDMDRDDVDLGPFVQLANFLRGAAFEIR
jgi:hypothetical protein